MPTSHEGLTGRGYTALLLTAVIVAASSMMPQATFAKPMQIGEDMGKCQQKFTGGHGFKDKMCACKDSACAQLTGDYQLVLMRSSTSTEDDAGSVQHTN